MFTFNTVYIHVVKWSNLSFFFCTGASGVGVNKLRKRLIKLNPSTFQGPVPRMCPLPHFFQMLHNHLQSHLKTQTSIFLHVASFISVYVFSYQIYVLRRFSRSPFFSGVTSLPHSIMSFSVPPDTTRPFRAGEQTGKEYHFVTKELFEYMVCNHR